MLHACVQPLNCPKHGLPRLYSARYSLNTTDLFSVFITQGEFDEEGNPHGTGTYYYASGETYEGSFEHGQLEGAGTFIFSR